MPDAYPHETITATDRSTETASATETLAAARFDGKGVAARTVWLASAFFCAACGILLTSLGFTHTIPTQAAVLAIIGAATAIVIVFSQRELRTLVAVNRDLAVSDPLTGAANSRRLDAALKSATKLTARPTTIAFFTLDLDDFAIVNERYGHDCGDEVLRAVAYEIDALLEPGDLLARRGGDEFSVLVTAADDRDLELLEDELREAIRRARLHSCPLVTASGSVAHVVYEPGESVERMLLRCEAALHEAKLDAHPERRYTKTFGDANSMGQSRGQSGRITGGSSPSARDSADDFEIEQAISRSIGTAPAWRVFTVMFYATGCAFAAALLTGSEAALPRQLLLTVAAAMFAGSAIATRGAKRQLGAGVLRIELLAMIGLIACAAFNAGSLGPALADLFVAPVVCAIYAFGERRAWPYVTASAALFCAVVVTSGSDVAVVQIATTLTAMLALCRLLGRSRAITHECAERAIALSMVDMLTGLGNLRGLRRALAQAATNADAESGVLALIAIDLDDFKQVNDRHSHSLGDQVLGEVASAMRSVTRPGDYLARSGGDEFAIVCRAGDESELMYIAGRVNEAICLARESMIADVTPTAGVSTTVWTGDDESIDAFFARSEQDLQLAKLVAHERNIWLDEQAA